MGQVAAPDRGLRSGRRKPRGDLEIHRPDAGWPGAQVDLADGREIGHHLALAAGAGLSRAGTDGHHRPRLVGPRQDRPRRRLARRRPELAGGAAFGRREVEGPDALSPRHRLGRQGDDPAIPRDGRDGLCPAHQGSASCDPRPE